MDNKISLDTSNIYLMQPHASVDPLYGPYQSINDAVSALSEDYAEVVKPGLFFAVKDGDTYKQYIVNSLDPFDYEPAQTEQFVVGDSGSISWRVDSQNVNYADVKVGTGITKNENGIALKSGKGITIGTDDSIALKLGSGVKFDLSDAIAISIGTGLQFNNIENNVIQVRNDVMDAIAHADVDYGNGLQRIGDEVSVKVGSGITIGSDNSTKLKLGSGVKFDIVDAVAVDAGNGLQLQPDGKLAVSGSIIDAVQELSSLSFGSGLTKMQNNEVIAYTDGTMDIDDSGRLCVSLGTIAGNGLMQHGQTVQLRLGSGLGFDGAAIYSAPVSVRIGTGLQFNNEDNNTVQISTSVMASIQNADVTYGYGLQRNNNEIAVRLGDGLTFMNYGYVTLRRKDNSLVFDNGATRVNLDSSYLELGSNGIRTKLSSGLGVDENGLCVTVGTGITKSEDGGLSITTPEDPLYIDSQNRLALSLSSDLVHETASDYGKTLKLSTDPQHPGLGARFDGQSIVLGNDGLCVNLDAASMQTTNNGISPKVDNASIVIGSDGIQSRGLIIKRKDADAQQYVVVGNTNNYSGQLILGSGVTAYIDNNELHVEADLGFLDQRYQRIQ